MKFKLLYIDPPYKFNNKKTGGSMKSAYRKMIKLMEVERW